MALGTPLPKTARTRLGSQADNSSMGYTPPVTTRQQYGGSMNTANQAAGNRYAGQGAAYQGGTPSYSGPSFRPQPRTGGGYQSDNPSVAYGATPPTAFDQAYGYYAAQNGGAMAQLGVNDSMLGMDAGRLQGQYDLAAQYAGQDMGFGARQYDLNMAGIGVDQGAAARQEGYYGNLLGLGQDNLAREMGLLDQSAGLYQDSAGRAQAYILDQLGFNQTGYNLDTANIEQGALMQTRGQRDDAAARGANTTAGNRWALDDINKTEAYQLGQAELDFTSTNASLNDQGDQIREQLARQLLGIEGERGDLQYGWARESLSLTEQQAQSRDQMRHLDIRAQEAGLTRDQMASNIQRQLAQSHLDRFFGMADVLAALDSNDIQRQQLAEQIIRQATAGAASGYFG